MSRADTIRRIVEEHQAATIDGMLVDAFSASAFIKVYDHVADDEPKRKLMEEAPLVRVMDVVWRCVS